MKVILPASLDRPKTCRNNIAIDIASVDEYSLPDKGKYKVHPALTPPTLLIDSNNNCMASTLIQKARLFSLGVEKSIKLKD
jgi:hypothetical protein